MAFTNERNKGTLIGRLSRAPQIFPNKDGSHKVMMTIAVRDNFKTKGEFETQFIPVQAFVPSGATILESYESLQKGQLLALGTSLRTHKYQKDDETVYETVVAVQSIDFTLESQATRDARAMADQDLA